MALFEIEMMNKLIYIMMNRLTLIYENQFRKLNIAFSIALMAYRLCHVRGVYGGTSEIESRPIERDDT